MITSKEKSIANNGFITFRKKAQDINQSGAIARQFYDIVNVLKPIAPLFESFQSYQIIMSYVNDQDLQKSLVSYYERFGGMKNGFGRLKALGKVE